MAQAPLLDKQDSLPILALEASAPDLTLAVPLLMALRLL